MPVPVAARAVAGVAASRRGTSKDPTYGEPTAADRRRLRREARADDARIDAAYRDGTRNRNRAAYAEDPALLEAWEFGRDAGRDEARGRKTSTSPGRRVGRRRATRRPITRRVVREATAPVRRQVYSGTRTLALMLLLVGLYLLLENAAATVGVIGALSKGLEWLRAPDRSIPYGAPR